MTRQHSYCLGFSLVEVTLAVGIAAFCFVTVLGLMSTGLQTQQASSEQTIATAILSAQAADLRAAVRYPPGLQNQLNDQQRTLNNHWALVSTPDTLYFTINGMQTGGVSPSSPPADAAFRMTLTYLRPPTETTSLASMTVSWPARVDSTAGVPKGIVKTFIAINRG